MTSLATAAGPPSAARGGVGLALKAGLLLLGGGLLFGFLAGDFAASGHSAEVLALAGVLIPVAVWHRPQLGPVVLLTAAVLVQQVVDTGITVTEAGVGIVPNAPPPPITSHIPLFQGLGSIHLEPADLLLLMVAIVYIARTDAATRCWPRSHVSRAMAALLGCVVLGIFIGMSHHGAIRESLMEARPYVYLASCYVLTAVLVRTRSAIRTVLWAFVIACGLRALQGIYVFIQIMSWKPRPESVLSHEDAYIFGVYILLVAVLWLFDLRGSLRKTATWLLPLIILANLANDRRAAWLLLGGGLLTMGAIGYRALPHRRLQIRRVVMVLLAFSAVYLPLYWNKTGTLAQPAVGLRSEISPNTRDSASDLYRVQEDANLKLNIKQGGVLGKGFGVPIDYALPIVDLSKVDPEIKYVPHNGVLYILMRMGILGAIAFWSLLGTAIVAGCRLARSVDREIAAVGALVACSMVAYALEGATDQGFYFYRIAFLTGVLLGLAEAARRINRLTGHASSPAPGTA